MNANDAAAQMTEAQKSLASAAEALTRAIEHIEAACGAQSARNLQLNAARAAVNAEIDDIQKTWFPATTN